MTNPFADPSPALFFTCPHCKKELPIEGDKVVLCDCPASLQQESLDRQRITNWRRDQEQLQQNRRKR